MSDNKPLPKLKSAGNVLSGENAAGVTVNPSAPLANGATVTKGAAPVSYTLPPFMVMVETAQSLMWLTLIPLHCATLAMYWYEVDVVNSNFYSGARDVAGARHVGAFGLVAYAGCRYDALPPASTPPSTSSTGCTGTEISGATFPAGSIQGPGAQTLASISTKPIGLIVICILSSLIGVWHMYGASAVEQTNAQPGVPTQTRTSLWKWYSVTVVHLFLQWLFCIASIGSYQTDLTEYVNRFMGKEWGPGGPPKLMGGGLLAQGAVILTMFTLILRCMLLRHAYKKDTASAAPANGKDGKPGTPPAGSSSPNPNAPVDPGSMLQVVVPAQQQKMPGDSIYMDPGFSQPMVPPMVITTLAPGDVRRSSRQLSSRMSGKQTPRITESVVDGSMRRIHSSRSFGNMPPGGAMTPGSARMVSLGTNRASHVDRLGPLPEHGELHAQAPLPRMASARQMQPQSARRL